MGKPDKVGSDCLVPGRLLEEGKVGRQRQTHMDTRHAHDTYDNMRGDDTPLSHGAGGLTCVPVSDHSVRLTQHRLIFCLWCWSGVTDMSMYLSTFV